MLVFHGGLTIEQVDKMKNGISVIYDKIPYKRACAGSENTFNYVPKELYSAPLHIFKRYISENVYSKQYIFFAKYLKASLGFCVNGEKKNYIMVCEIPEEILDSYIGVGNYDDYRIEYRVPREVITPDRIKEFLFFKPYDREQMMELRQKYPEHYDIPKYEDEMARNLMKIKRLEFNGKRNWK